MNIGLVDVDGHNFPNLALMKLSAWHKSQGDSVEFADPMFGRYDLVYMSKVFTFTADCLDIYHCEVIRAGPGIKTTRQRYPMRSSTLVRIIRYTEWTRHTGFSLADA